MRDSEYILDKLIETINDNLKVVESRMIKGNIQTMEDYRYNLGMRFILSTLQEEIKELNRSN
jgi:hypothetical protein